MSKYSTDTPGCASIILGGIVLIITLVAGPIFNGYALSILWAWFIIPTFSAPSLSIPAAIGISLVVAYLTKQEQPSDPARRDWTMWQTLACAVLTIILKPAGALFMGWIVQKWM